MQLYDLITSIPSTLSCIVLREWLNLKSVMTLDSAYCCHSHRSDFLDQLQSEEYFIREQVTIDLGYSVNSFVASLLERFGEKLRSVELCGHGWNDVEPLPVNLISTHCHYLTHVKFSTVKIYTQEVWDLLRANSHIESLTTLNSFVVSPLFRFVDEIVLPKLNTLVVKGYNMQSKNVLGVIKGGQVVQLNLSRCEITMPVLLEICSHCPHVQALVLSFLYAESLTDETLNKLTTLRPHIAHLDITGAEQITDSGILNIVQNLAGLRSFNIIGGSQLTDLSFTYIYTYHGETLSTLLFDYQGMHGPTFGASAITNLIERCTQLHTMHIYDWYKNTIPLTFPSSAVYHLTSLVIGGAIVTEQNVTVIATHAANLQVLEIDSEQVHETIFDLANSHPKLRELHYDFRCAYKVSIPEKLVRASRENVRPGLLVTLKSVQSGSTWRPSKPACFNF